MATNTAASFTNHTGNGNTDADGKSDAFPISFAYLAESEVDVLVGTNLTPKTQGQHYEFASATTIKFLSGNVPGNGVAIKFQRDTDISAKKVDFQDGSVLTETDLDTNADQVLFAQQEITDKLAGIEDGATADQTISEIKSLIAGSPLDASHLAANSVDSSELVDGSVDTSHLSDNCVTNAKIANNAINRDKLQDDSVGSSEILANAITASELANNAVETAKINNDAVTTNKIADHQITDQKLASNSVTTPRINGSAVTEAKIADNAVTRAKLADDSVGSSEILANAITASELANNAVETAKINNSAVTEGKIADNAVTSAKIATDAVDSPEIKNNAILEAKITNNAVTENKIIDNAVTTSKIAPQPLKTLANMQQATASKLADSTALTSDIADLNQIDGLTKQTGNNLSNTENSFPTSAAVVSYVTAQLAPIGGLEVIATDAAFPNTQPPAGVVISIADAGGLVVSSGGTSTTARTVGGTQVTINNFASNFNSSTVDAGVAIMVSSTGANQEYNYHKATLKEADLLNLSNDINDFGNRYRVFAGEPTSDNNEGDLVYDKNADKMKVFDSSLNAFKEVTSVGDFKFLFLCPAGGSGSPTINGSIATYDLREGGTSGSSASVTNAAQLLVSINGVIQKPNTGSSAPSEGFAMVDSNTIIFGSNLPTGAEVFVIQIGSAVSLQVPADNTVATSKLQNASVTTAKIQDGAVNVNKIADNAVTTAKIINNAVNVNKIADNAVIASKILNNNVTTDKIADQAVTLAKLPHGTSSNDGKFLRANNGADPSFETINTTPADGSITTAKLADNSVDSDKLAHGLHLFCTGSDKGIILQGNIGEIGDVTGFQAVNDAANANTDFGIRANTIRFATTTAERARVTDNGITFNGDTAAANALDDYEEGTWTPAYNAGGAASACFASGISYNTGGQTGVYTKIGNVVYFRFHIDPASSGLTAKSGILQVNGLPFTSANTTHINSGAAFYMYSNAFGSATLPMAVVIQNNAVIQFYQTNGSAFAGTSLSAPQNAIQMVGMYHVA